MAKLVVAAALAASLALAGCGDGSDDGSPTAEENRLLNEAAEMLDTSPDDLVPAEEEALGNGEEEVAGDENAATGNESAGNAAAGNGQ